jgi:hypothetical protein
MSIPKTIYLTWKNNDVPCTILSSWRQLNPGYSIEFFTDHDCFQFLKTYFNDDYADFFNEIPYGAIKADWWRLCVLYLWGGVYVDIDVQPLSIDWDTILKDCDGFTAIGLFDDSMFQAVMAFPQGCPLLQKNIQVMFEKRSLVRKYLSDPKSYHAEDDLYGTLSGTYDLFHILVEEYGPLEEGINDCLGGFRLKLGKEILMGGESFRDSYVSYLGQVYFRSRYPDYYAEWMYWPEFLSSYGRKGDGRLGFQRSRLPE